MYTEKKCDLSKKEIKMNTEKSDKIVKEWKQKKNKLKRGTITKEIIHKVSPQALFKLLCPTTEYDWIPYWECELLHSSSGYAEYNAIFRTKINGPEETWVCTRYEPDKAVQYVRVSKNMCGKLDISIIDNGDGTVTNTWITTVSALNSEGNKYVEVELENYEKRFKAVSEALKHYITTGEMIS